VTEKNTLIVCVCVCVCDFVQNRSFTSGLNPCKCTTRKSDPCIFFLPPRYPPPTHTHLTRRPRAPVERCLEILGEIPGQELNEEPVHARTLRWVANILRFQMPVKRPKGYCVTRADGVILYRRRARGEEKSFFPYSFALFNGNTFWRKSNVKV